MDSNETGETNVTMLMVEVLQNITTPRVRNIRYLSAEENREVMQIVFYIHGVFYCFLGFTGVITNLVNIVTLARSTKLVTYKIFLAMACSDLMVMVILLGYSLAFGVYNPPKVYLGSPPKLKPGITYSLYLWQNLWFHIMNGFMCISNWCVVLVATFRLLVISFPLKAVTYASATRVHICIATVYLLGFAAQIPGWIGFKFDNHGALRVNPHTYKYTTVTLVLNAMLPLVISAIATALLVVQLGRNQKQMRHSLQKERLAERVKDQRQLTVTLLLVVCFFIVMNLPTNAYWIMDEHGYFDKYQISGYHQTIFYLVASGTCAISYTSNFFIYILANATFRKDLKAVFMKLKAVVCCQPFTFIGSRKRKSLGPSSRTHSTAIENHSENMPIRAQ